MPLKDHVPASLKSDALFFFWDYVDYGVVAQGLGKYPDPDYTGNQELDFFAMWWFGVEELFTYY